MQISELENGRHGLFECMNIRPVYFRTHSSTVFSPFSSGMGAVCEKAQRAGIHQYTVGKLASKSASGSQ